MRVIAPRFVFGGAIVLFGVCATCIAVSGGYAGLMVLRTILGMGEATLTLAFLYASYWYRPDELALRNGKSGLLTAAVDASSQRDEELMLCSTPQVSCTARLPSQASPAA